MSGQTMIETERLTLRGPERDDYLLLCDLVADPEVHQFLGPRSGDPKADAFSRALRGAGSFHLYGYGTFMAFERESGTFVGQMGVFHSWRGFGKGLDDVGEAGWIVARPHWGKGYAREGMVAALDWVEASHGLKRTACMIERGNGASVRLAERLGYLRYDEHELDGGTIVDLFERFTPTG